MCLAIPMQIEEINNDKAIANMSGVKREISIKTLSEPPKIGDFVIVHAGFAIEVLDEEKARETLGVFSEMSKLLEDMEEQH
jgi:hydrogenase expression/formation protein HypC